MIEYPIKGKEYRFRKGFHFKVTDIEHRNESGHEQVYVTYSNALNQLEYCNSLEWFKRNFTEVDDE